MCTYMHCIGLLLCKHTHVRIKMTAWRYFWDSLLCCLLACLLYYCLFSPPPSPSHSCSLCECQSSCCFTLVLLNPLSMIVVLNGGGGEDMNRATRMYKYVNLLLTQPLHPYIQLMHSPPPFSVRSITTRTTTIMSADLTACKACNSFNVRSIQ